MAEGGANNNDETDGISFLKIFKRKHKDKMDSGRINDKDSDSDDSDSPIGPIISIPTDEIYYNTKHVNIGLALIFNHTDIDGQKKRSGTDKDRQRIRRALNHLGFMTRTYDDLTAKGIQSILFEVSQEDHSENDCFVVVVMTHGRPGELYAKDTTYKVENLWKPFLGKNCKTLRNKPKIFFIQACRGEELEQPVQYQQPRMIARSFNVATDFATPPPPPPPEITYTIPNTADLLIMYSTFEGNFSWRNPLNGSWFIQSLSYVLEQAARSTGELELIELLTAVNRKVAYEYQSNVPGNEKFDEMKEMPNFISTLTKTFKFEPKN